ncbi:MFS transporter [Solirubrobacter sp. CPCC 204708]|uniref:MFS transporter n=1 Tax=Solirubrobacter deserti TaxID=2282478 RepID=A0ABT4RPI1_9ACTN|nr:MFS transporter [Solirubrobacter deserti]MBE2319194.1 MFS transporter [Solirubrobacter deserti]MDA0140200.1 MFS transporter [Solirubrobacter deserti]
MAGLRRALVAIAAALALADASIVALALPPILVEYDTSISGAAAIVGVYALVLALCLWPARQLRAGPAGLLVFAAASVGCALAPNLWLMLVFRALQAAGAAAALLTAYHVLEAGESDHGRRWWLGAALIGTAAGPAIGGALTEILDWRAIFAVQVPLALAAAWACRAPAGEAGSAPAAAPGGASPPTTGASPSATGASPLATGASPRAAAASSPATGASSPTAAASSPAADTRSLAALALTTAAFTAVLFLLVIELVAGFAISPLRAALGVSVLPLAALAAAAIPGERQARALAGAVLLAGGGAALAFLPAPTIAWTLAPQVLAGAGMGLALPALSPERNLTQAARTLVARHVGIVLVLAILAPVATAQLNRATDEAILKGASLVLDAQIDPLQKLELAPALLDDLNTDAPRQSLTDAVATRRGEFADNPAVYDRLGQRLDDVVVAAVLEAFQVAYLIAAALAIVAALVLIPHVRRPAMALAAALAAGCAVVYVVEGDAEAPPAVALADPCNPPAVPGASGLAGALQERVLAQLNQAACRLEVTREELALAIFDADRAQEFEAEHGVDPRGTIDLLSLLGGG